MEHGDLADVGRLLELAQESLQAVHALMAQARLHGSS